MRGVKRGQESTGRMKKPRDSHEFKVTAVKMATAPEVETKAVAEALNIHPFMLSRWKKEVREGMLTGAAHPKLKELKAMEVTVAEEQRIRDLEATLKKASIENALVKQAVRFNVERSRPSSRS